MGPYHLLKNKFKSKFMLFNSLIYLLFSNSVTLIRDLSVHFNKIAILVLQYSITLHIISLLILMVILAYREVLFIYLILYKSFSLFSVFYFFISILILQFTSFFPIKVLIYSPLRGILTPGGPGSSLPHTQCVGGGGRD